MINEGIQNEDARQRGVKPSSASEWYTVNTIGRALAHKLQNPDACPNCGSALYERGCKIRCPNNQCGYFVSCSEW